jgi:hypothetical protein
VAAVAVSLIHGCALQALIEPKAFSVQQHFDTAARMLDGFRGDNDGTARRPRRRAIAPATSERKR